jgi:hypothetical protein
MARVLHRRPKPPYLLIIFVFLFLVSTTLAVLFYTRYDEANEVKAKQEAELKKIALERERNKGYVKQRLALEQPPADAPKTYDNAEEEVGWAKARTVIARLEGHLKTLAYEVTARTKKGEGDDPISQSLEAQKELDRTQDYVAQRKLKAGLGAGVAGPGGATKAFQWSGVEKEMERAYGAVDAEARLHATASKELSKARQTVSSLEKDKTGLTEALRQEREAHKATSGELDTAQTALADTRKELAATAKTSSNRKAELESARKQVQQLDDKVHELTLAVEKHLATIKRLQDEKKMRDIRVKRAILSTRPDGRIVKVVDDQNLCYIDIGLNQKVEVGVTFSVYPRTGIPVPPTSKGSIVVIRADESRSTCRITKQSDDDPVDVGDLIANLAFDPQRTYTFIVEGQFDLYNTGKPNPIDRQEVIALVRRFGGKIAKEVTAQTDYVVLGVPPKKPERSEDAFGLDEEQFRQLTREYESYYRTQQEAKQFGIPVLNTNRFLDLVGYTPRKTR